jgi:hypothetical protein
MALPCVGMRAEPVMNVEYEEGLPLRLALCRRQLQQDHRIEAAAAGNGNRGGGKLCAQRFKRAHEGGRDKPGCKTAH